MSQLLQERVQGPGQTWQISSGAVQLEQVCKQAQPLSKEKQPLTVPGEEPEQDPGEAAQIKIQIPSTSSEALTHSTVAFPAPGEVLSLPT